MKPPSTAQLKVMVENFLADPAVGAVLTSMPEKLRSELLCNENQFLGGYLEGVGRCLETLKQVDNNLKLGRVDKAVSLRSMLSATVLLCVQELLRRAEAEVPEQAQAGVEENHDQDK